MLRFLRSGGKHTKTIWWFLIIITVVTFLGGFVFIFGSGLGSGSAARVSGAVATVNGQQISRTEWQNALNEQRTAFQAQYGDEPGEREMQSIESQAFRALVLQKLLDRKARSLGLEAHDRDVVLQLQTNPPQQLLASAMFQTNGRFDQQKYQTAMRDPNNNWGPFEQMVRDQMPVRKLQERLFTSIKLTEGELRREWRDHNEKVNVTAVVIGPNPSAPAPKVSDADLSRVYERYRDRFVSGPQRRLELLLVPKQFGDAPTKAASELATGLVKRIRAGEDFAALSREYSDAPGAERGGVIDRNFTAGDFGSQLGPQLAVMDTGRVTDPVRDGGRFMFFKLLQKLPPGANGQPGIRVAQFIVRIKPDEDALHKQEQQLEKLRSQAQREGLGHAASALALTTTKTGFFDLSNTPRELAAVPSAADWAFGAKPQEVSPVINALDYFAVVQLIASKGEGPMPQDAITDQLRQLAQLEASIDSLKPKADAIEAALKSGKTLEQAAAQVGLTAQKIDGVMRDSQDMRLFGQPELLGRLFAARPGEVVGPIRGLSGYVTARVESRVDVDWTAFEASRGQFAQQTLEARQRAFMERFTSSMRARAQVKDLRGNEEF